MRTLRRNKQKIKYALFENKIPVLDEYGNDTGEFELLYSEPKDFEISVSSARGESYTRHFGDSVDYDKVMVTTDKSFPINESSILWVDDLSEGKPHDYTVKKVAASLNSISYAISKVNVGE
ncbi:MAG: hypothetical protein GX375_05125 [Clostridiales bacterium]|nr:hypothetical protein [Clostridiales bacterium]